MYIRTSVVEAEARVTQLTAQLQSERQALLEERNHVNKLTDDVNYYREQVDDLKRQNRQLHLDLSLNRQDQVEGQMCKAVVEILLCL